MQTFGGPWTLLKLDILEKYLQFYFNALKNQRFKFCYIDAFAGSGKVNIKGIGNIKGSASRALEYPFDKYVFIEKEVKYATELKDNLLIDNIQKNIEIKLGDCNDLLETINSVSWYEKFWRGVIFLDPYAMNLKWKSLESIAKTQTFDVWYLFPLSAVNRVLQRDGNIPSKNKQKINNLLGTSDWEKAIYHESPQIHMLGEQKFERVSIHSI